MQSKATGSNHTTAQNAIELTTVRMPVDIALPMLGVITVQFGVIDKERTTLQEADALRVRLGGTQAIGILYDVSPPVDSQELVGQLSNFRRMAICDHHGGAAPLQEIAGREVTGAEILARDLTRLSQSGVFAAEQDGSPAAIVGITNSMNIDPDSIICRYLLDAFCDPNKRAEAWSAERLQLAIDVARFGDTTFFGGIHIPSMQYQDLAPAVRISLSIMQMINEEKEDIVLQSKFSEALLAANIRRAAFTLALNGDNQTPFKAMLGIMRTISRDPHTAQQVLSGILGADLITVEGLKAGFTQEGRAQGLGAEALKQFCRVRLSNFTFHNLSRNRVKEVFHGKDQDDCFGPAHPVLFDLATIGELFRNVSARLQELMRDPDLCKPFAERFIADLKDVHEMGKRYTTVLCPHDFPDREVAVTVLRDRMDRDPEKFQTAQRHPIWDWLREAGAAFADPWLHVMDRGSSIVVSSRFAREGEERPCIDLSEPVTVAKLIDMEKQAAALQGQPAADFLIKANLWLPIGKPHFSRQQVVELLQQSYDRIVQPAGSKPTLLKPKFTEVNYPWGRGEFDGSSFISLPPVR